MTGPTNFKCKQLRRCMAHNLPSSAGRERTLHHVKLAAGIIPDDDGAAAAGGGGGAGAPLCAWLLAGSHNLSGAAWGKVEEVKAEGSEGETELVMMSFELSVLLVPLKPLPHALPWRSPAPRYDPTEVKP